MAYTKEITDTNAIADLARRMPPCGAGWSPELAAQVVLIKQVESAFSDPGPDYVEFEGYNAAGEQVAYRYIGGY